MAARQMTDEDGVEWHVYDVVLPEQLLSSKKPHHPFNLPNAWLCFESAGERRRLSPIPKGWEEAAHQELCRLLHLATRSGERRGTGPRRTPPEGL